MHGQVNELTTGTAKSREKKRKYRRGRGGIEHTADAEEFAIPQFLFLFVFFFLKCQVAFVSFPAV